MENGKAFSSNVTSSEQTFADGSAELEKLLQTAGIYKLNWFNHSNILDYLVFAFPKF